jgi:hypothetical protein
MSSSFNFDDAATQRTKTDKTLITLIENQIIQARSDGLYSVIISQPSISTEVKEYFVSLNYGMTWTQDNAFKFFW